MRNWIVFFICCLVLLTFWILIVTDDKPEPTVQTSAEQTAVATQTSEDYADYYVPTGRELTDEEAAAMGLTDTEQVLVVEDNPEPYVIAETSESTAEG